MNTEPFLDYITTSLNQSLELSMKKARIGLGPSLTITNASLTFRTGLPSPSLSQFHLYHVHYIIRVVLMWLRFIEANASGSIIAIKNIFETEADDLKKYFRRRGNQVDINRWHFVFQRAFLKATWPSFTTMADSSLAYQQNNLETYSSPT